MRIEKFLYYGIFLIVWGVIGWLFSDIQLFTTWIVVPLVVFIIEKKYREEIDFNYIDIIWSYMLIIIVDLLFRKFSDGIIDDAARGILLVSFYVTTLFTTIVSIFNIAAYTKKHGKSLGYKYISFMIIILLLEIVIYRFVIFYKYRNLLN